MNQMVTPSSPPTARLPACVLETRYSGPTTIAHLLSSYVDTTYMPFNDEMLAVRHEGVVSVRIEFPVSLEPRRTREFGDVYKTTAEILAELASFGMRALNVPEALALGNLFPSANFVALGQGVKTRFGKQAVYIIRHTAGLLPFDRPWSPSFSLPATRDTDPLA